MVFAIDGDTIVGITGFPDRPALRAPRASRRAPGPYGLSGAPHHGPRTKDGARSEPHEPALGVLWLFVTRFEGGLEAVEIADLGSHRLGDDRRHRALQAAQLGGEGEADLGRIAECRQLVAPVGAYRPVIVRKATMRSGVRGRGGRPALVSNGRQRLRHQARRLCGFHRGGASHRQLLRSYREAANPTDPCSVGRRPQPDAMTPPPRMLVVPGDGVRDDADGWGTRQASSASSLANAPCQPASACADCV